MIPEVIGAIVTRSSSDFWGCGFPGGSDGKESAMREPRVLSLSREDPLEEEMATHSSILAGEIHGQRSLAGYSPWGRKESDRTEGPTSTHLGL